MPEAARSPGGAAGPRLHRLEEVKNVLCARGRPQSQEPMVGVRERPPAADGDEAGITVFGEDYGCTLPVASAQRLALPAAGEKQARKRKPPKLRTKLQKRAQLPWQVKHGASEANQ